MTPRPKQRRIRPPWSYRPGSRAAFVHGCTCSVLPGLLGDTSPAGVCLERQVDAEGGYYYRHGPSCPSRRPEGQ